MVTQLSTAEPALRWATLQEDWGSKDARHAVITGDGDALGLWIGYRLETARLLGIWQALIDRHRTDGGTRTPEGPAPRVPSLPSPGVVGESFEGFVLGILRGAEPRATADALAATRDTLTQATK